jgi:hypothetical protein
MATLFERSWRADLRQVLADAYRDARFVLSEDDYDAWRTSVDAQAAAIIMAAVDKGGRQFKVQAASQLSQLSPTQRLCLGQGQARRLL